MTVSLPFYADQEDAYSCESMNEALKIHENVGMVVNCATSL